METEEQLRRIELLMKWQAYATKRIVGLKRRSQFSDGNILTLVELEVPSDHLGFCSFEEFLSSLDISTLFPEDRVIRESRTLSELGSLANIKYGDRIIWFPQFPEPEQRDQVSLKGIVKWIGTINNLVVAGIEFDVRTGLGPFFWKKRVLFECTSGQGKVVPLVELVPDNGNDSTKSVFKQFTDNVSSMLQTIGEGIDTLTSAILSSSESQEQAKDILGFHPRAVDTLPNGLKVGDLAVWVSQTGNRDCVVAWIGYLRLNGHLFAGIDLQADIGDTDGTYLFYKLYECPKKHGKFVYANELLRFADFYGEVANSGSPQKSEANSIATLMNISGQKRSILKRMGLAFAGDFQIRDYVSYCPSASERWNGIVLWKSSEDVGNGEILYGIEFEKPTGITANGELALPFVCKSGHGALAPRSKLIRYVPSSTLGDSVDLRSPSATSPQPT